MTLGQEDAEEDVEDWQSQGSAIFHSLHRMALSSTCKVGGGSHFPFLGSSPTPTDTLFLRPGTSNKTVHLLYGLTECLQCNLRKKPLSDLLQPVEVAPGSAGSHPPACALPPP